MQLQVLVLTANTRILFFDGYFPKSKICYLWHNAVTRETLSEPEELEIVTLENAIYMGMKNDLAFVLKWIVPV